MSYQPQFTITPAPLSRAENIAALRERIQGATVQVPWIPALQKETRARNTRSSTAIEGNPLTLEEGVTVAAPRGQTIQLCNLHLPSTGWAGPPGSGGFHQGQPAQLTNARMEPVSKAPLHNRTKTISLAKKRGLDPDSRAPKARGTPTYFARERLKQRPMKPLSALILATFLQFLAPIVVFAQAGSENDVLPHAKSYWLQIKELRFNTNEAQAARTPEVVRSLEGCVMAGSSFYLRSVEHGIQSMAFGVLEERQGGGRVKIEYTYDVAEFGAEPPPRRRLNGSLEVKVREPALLAPSMTNPPSFKPEPNPAMQYVLTVAPFVPPMGFRLYSLLRVRLVDEAGLPVQNALTGMYSPDFDSIVTGNGVHRAWESGGIQVEVLGLQGGVRASPFWGWIPIYKGPQTLAKREKKSKLYP